MKKKNNFMIIGMLFMASIILELYFLLEFRDTVSLIVGGGAIVLLTTYLLLDWIQTYFMSKSTIPEQNTDAFSIQSGLADNKLLEELVKIQKACYIVLCQMKELNREEQKELLEVLEIYKEQIIEVEENATKLVVKYHREDIKCMIVNIKESASKIASSIERIATKSNVPDIVDGVGQSIENLEFTISRIEELLKQKNCLEN